MSDIKLYFLNSSPYTPEQLQSVAERFLSPEERLKAQGFSLLSRRHEFVVGRALSRYALAAHVNRQNLPQVQLCQIDKTDKGRPFFVETGGSAKSNIDFSITHTSDFVACAFSADRTLGLDVELISRASKIDDVKARVFSPYEILNLSKLKGVDRDLRLLQIWTGKEAWTKAIGEGLGFDFSRLSINFENVEPVLLDENAQKIQGWHLTSIMFEQYCLTLAQEVKGTQRKNIDMVELSLPQLLSFGAIEQ